MSVEIDVVKTTRSPLVSTSSPQRLPLTVSTKSFLRDKLWVWITCFCAGMRWKISPNGFVILIRYYPRP
jgi:hypothetical protein